MCTTKLVGLGFFPPFIISFFLFFFNPLLFSPHSIVLFDTFVNILSHNLGEPAYEADVAQLEYKLVAGEHGLVIRVKGFNHKLPVSTDDLLNTQACFCSVCVLLLLAAGAWLAGP